MKKIIKKSICILTACLLMLGYAFPGMSEERETDAYNWYEVFVYSYQDSDGDGIGDINGLIKRLDYIHDMGYNGIWLMPIMPSPSYHKYDVTDYFDIDPQYGTLEDFRRVVAKCHELGIRIIIDMPLNHTSTRHPWFQDACLSIQKRTCDSPYMDYYHFTETPGQQDVKISGAAWYYEEQFSGGNMPDLNLENPDVMSEIKTIFDFWLNDVGVDGFRLDAVTSYVSHNTKKNVEILRQLKDMAEELKPGSYLVGEAWTGLGDIAEYYKSGVDSFFLFPFAQAEGDLVRSMLSRSNPAANFVTRMEKTYAQLTEGVLAPFLCNHDTGRAVVALQARSNAARAKFAQGVLNMVGGNTFTYYGDEIGMVGSGDDPNKRLAMYWNDQDMTRQPPGVTKVEYAYPSVDEQLIDPASLLNYCKKVNHVKLDYPLIARGENSFIYSDGNVCVLKKELNGECLYVAMNFSASKTESVMLEINDLAICADLETGDEHAAVQEQDGKTCITLPPYAIIVMN